MVPDPVRIDERDWPRDADAKTANFVAQNALCAAEPQFAEPPLEEGPRLFPNCTRGAFVFVRPGAQQDVALRRKSAKRIDCALGKQQRIRHRISHGTSLSRSAWPIGMGRSPSVKTIAARAAATGLPSWSSSCCRLQLLRPPGSAATWQTNPAG